MTLCKKLYVLYYKLFDRKYYQNGLKFIDRQIKRFEGNVSPKEYQKLVVDMVYSLHRFGASFDEYFQYRFKHLSTYGRDQFVTDKLRYAYYEIMIKKEAMSVLVEKDKTYAVFSKYFWRDFLKISGKNDFDAFSEFVKKHAQMVVKPYRGASGDGVELVSRDDYKDIPSLFEYVFSKGEVVIEELIKSHPELKRLHEHSVNTIRVMTIKTKDANEVLFAVVRTGRNKSFVDNANSGGIYADIDVETGIIKTAGVDHEMNRYVTHPDSGVPFVGFQIPMWESLLNIVNELADVVSSTRCVGWDLTLSEKGWVLVEANPGGGIFLFQTPENIGKKKELEELVKCW